MEAGDPVRGCLQCNKIHPDERIGGVRCTEGHFSFVESVRRSGLAQLLVCF